MADNKISIISTIMENLKSGITSSDWSIFATCCAYFIVAYMILEKYVESTKSRSWILMMLASSVLSPFGAYYAFDVIWNSNWTNTYIYGEDFISRCVVLFFTASNVVDLIIGLIRYRKYVDPLTTVFHHFFYIVFMLVILCHNYSRGFVICFFMEIPTFILALGTVWPKFRSDYFFGVSFFLTRILFNAFQAYKLAQLDISGAIWKVCTFVLCVHLYWFKQWWDKYGSYYNYGYNLLQAEMSTIKVPKKVD